MVPRDISAMLEMHIHAGNRAVKREIPLLLDLTRKYFPKRGRSVLLLLTRAEWLNLGASALTSPSWLDIHRLEYPIPAPA